MNLWRITFTGVDESTPIDEMLELFRREPRLELGILFSDSRAGTGRYPSHAWITNVVQKLRRFSFPLALHVCGGARLRFLRDGQLTGFQGLADFDRVQLNGTFTSDEVRSLSGYLADPQDKGEFSIITQHDATPTLAGEISHERHQVLFDASGGEGIARGHWPTPIAGKPCGFAGRLGPDTIQTELPKIAAVSGGVPFWVDMESQLRIDDRFDLNKAHATLDRFAELSPLRCKSTRAG